MDRRALVALGLGLTVVLGILRLSGRGGEALRPEEPAGAGSAIEDEEPHLTAPLARSSEALRRERGTPPPVPRDALVLVRSDLGPPLERVEMEDGEAWREVVLEEGALSVPFAARPTRVRAPGHRAAEVENETKALTLAPHASLVLEAFPVERLERQDPFRGWPERAETGRRFLLAGPLDATSWAIALDPTRLRSLFPDLDMTFEFDDGSAALVTHELAADRHDVYRWPLAPEAVGRERLRVEIARAPGSSSPALRLCPTAPWISLSRSPPDSIPRLATRTDAIGESPRGRSPCA